MVYLDWNIYARMLEGKLSELRAILADGLELVRLLAPFTSSHVEEATGITGPQSEVERRLDLISEVSGDVYLVNDLLNLGFRTEHPKSVHQTLQAGDIGLDFNKLFANLISFDMLRTGRELLGLSSQELNNVSPEQAVDAIDRALLSGEVRDKYLQDYDGDVSFRGLLKTVDEITKQQFNPMYQGWGLNPDEVNNSSSYYVMAFSLFDSLGFWADKRDTYEKGSRFQDGMHAFYGSFCDYMVSDDKRFRHKSAATYSLLESPTLVLEPREAQEVLVSSL